ncbi:uncharacterized protein V1516DRAFT_685149 [Lipomyces oligophaga]|uniref:uncharacterized protein n=1 Tax=Lipomyces oligophaga TaxID=45792 RepID=UPI0034CE2EC7
MQLNEPMIRIFRIKRFRSIGLSHFRTLACSEYEILGHNRKQHSTKADIKTDIKIENTIDWALLSRHHQVSFDNRKVYVPWTEGVTSSFHHIWLRDHCQCESCFHPITKQRLLNTFQIPETLRPENVVANPTEVKVVWNDGHLSAYPLDWLHFHSYQPVLEKMGVFPRTLWTGDEIAANPPKVSYDDVMDPNNHGGAVADWTRKIKTYGFCFIDRVPTTPADTEALINRLSFPRNTHYGGFWDFTSNLAKADTAYTDLALPLHTDGTYFTDPPGLQLLHCLNHQGTGGDSILADGFKAARVLLEESPNHYKTLSRVRIPSHAAGNEDVCITTSLARAVLNHDDSTGTLFQVRWNNDDRSTIDRWSDPDISVPEFYAAIRAWAEILTRPEIVYRFKLIPGQPVIFDNWRVLHGRTAFTGQRRLCGAYINMDDFESRFRLSNYGRSRVLMEL